MFYSFYNQDIPFETSRVGDEWHSKCVKSAIVTKFDLI
jgi:hypothetical protein